MPRGVYDRSHLKALGRGARTRDYVDLSISKRELARLNKGCRVNKALNGTGKMVSLFADKKGAEKKSIQKKMDRLQTQLTALQGKLSKLGNI